MPKFYPSPVLIGQNIRKEFSAFLRGDASQPPTGQIVILRRMRRKEGVEYPLRESDLVLSEAVDPRTREGDVSHPNWYTDQERYYFDDELRYTYRYNLFDYTDRERIQVFGNLTINLTFFCFEHSVMPSRFDKILEPLTDGEGQLVSPIVIKSKHDIEMAQAYRGDRGWTDGTVGNARVEYWRCAVQGEPLKRS